MTKSSHKEIGYESLGCILLPLIKDQLWNLVNTISF